MLKICFAIYAENCDAYGEKKCKVFSDPWYEQSVPDSPAAILESYRKVDFVEQFYKKTLYRQ